MQSNPIQEKYTEGFIVLCFGYIITIYWIFVMYLPTSFRVTSMALGQSYDCPSACEVTLKDRGKIDLHQNRTKQEPLVKFSGCSQMNILLKKKSTENTRSSKSWNFIIKIRQDHDY